MKIHGRKHCKGQVDSQNLFFSSVPVSSPYKDPRTKDWGKSMGRIRELQGWMLFWVLPPAPAPRELRGFPALSSPGLG